MYIRKPPRSTHRVRYCASCGWTHTETSRVRVFEGNSAVIKALCSKCIKEQPVHVLCDLCGRTKCDNLYPVTITRKVMANGNNCNLFLHLCVECRKIPHHEILKRMTVPTEICDNCKDRFVCFTEKGGKPFNSEHKMGILDGKKQAIHKRVSVGSFMRGVLK